MNKIDLSLSMAGSLLAYGAAVLSIQADGGSAVALLWGCVALVGAFVFLFAAARSIGRTTGNPRPDPEKALGKTDSRFGRR